MRLVVDNGHGIAHFRREATGSPPSKVANEILTNYRVLISPSHWIKHSYAVVPATFVSQDGARTNET
jgi:hypothetical protein